ncbi:MAG: Ion channel [Subtercola sp.]|nr:Ion channel [Subtercola sp.]
MAKQRSELKNTGYEIFIGILSILSIVNLVLVYAVFHDESLQTVLGVMNGLFSLIFLGDFTYRIVTAPSRGAYFFKHFGWADLLASLPFPQFKILRVFRLIRVYRLLKQVGIKTIWRTLVKDRAGSALMVLLLLGILVLEFGSLTMLYIEKDAPGANITTASDAIWYIIVTISTVGYGDTYPVTNLGRLGGAVIIVIGVGIFGTFTGYLATVFLTPKSLDSEVDARAVATGSETPSEQPVVSPAPGVAGVAGVAVVTEVAGDTMAELRALLARSEADLAAMKALLH